MKKVININFQGRVIPIEESAYDVLKQYIDSLRRYFANEEGRDEIINDIEGRVAELFGEVLKKGSTCITEDDVNAIIASMGRPEDFDDDEAKVQSQLGAEKKQQQQQYTSAGSEQAYTGGAHGRFYRDENNKVVAGVCAGIANYFGIDPLVVRILFVIFSFAGGFGFITYLVLWVAVPSTASKVIGSAKKRLFRDSDNKLIAGVCSGLSNYFGVNVWIPRVLFLIPFISFAFRWSHWGAINFPGFLSLTFSPGTLLIYIILWLVFPEAQTTSEKLEMKGERVDLNSIKTTIQQDMEGFKDRAEKFGKEVGEKAQQFGKEMGSRGKQFGNEAGHIARRGGGGIGYVIGLIVKIFVYFVLGSILFGVVVGLFVAGIVLTGFLPWKDFLIVDGWQNIFAWGTLVLFIWVPVVGIITWIIRRIAKMRSNARTIRFAFVSLWLLGLFCVVGMFASLYTDFKYRSHSNPQTIAIAAPSTKKLEIKGLYPPIENDDNWFHFEPFQSIDGDTGYVKNTLIRLVLSDNDNFSVSIKKNADGYTRENANLEASKIGFHFSQRDSILSVNNFVDFNVHDKFRNQQIEIIIAVPKNGRIKVDESAKGYGYDQHFEFFNHNWNYDSWEGNDEPKYFDFERGVEYKMTQDGKLERTDGFRENADNNNDDNNNRADQPNNNNKAQSDSTNTYHYKTPATKQAKPATPVKPANKKTDSLPSKQAKAEIRKLNSPLAFVERFTI